MSNDNERPVRIVPDWRPGVFAFSDPDVLAALQRQAERQEEADAGRR